MPYLWHSYANELGNDSLKAIHTHLNKKKTDQFL